MKADILTFVQSRARHEEAQRLSRARRAPKPVQRSVSNQIRLPQFIQPVSTQHKQEDPVRGIVETAWNNFSPISLQIFKLGERAATTPSLHPVTRELAQVVSGVAALYAIVQVVNTLDS